MNRGRYTADSVPKNGVIMWSGSIATIPNGWALCNGQTIGGITTPDLRNKFIVCADADVGGVAKSTIETSAKQTGGAATHVHTGPSHTHTISGSANAASGFISVGLTSSTSGAASAANTGSQSSCPSFYALAYIIKL